MSATALALPGYAPTSWQHRDKNDQAANALADRHYSRRRPGSGQIGPPGRKIILVTTDEHAVWLTHWPKPELAMDNLDSWRCSIFRNESGALSSELIHAAMTATAQLWTDRPTDGWVTWVDPTKVRSTNPGYCFIRAGWYLDHTWTHRRLIRLRAPVTG